MSGINFDQTGKWIIYANRRSRSASLHLYNMTSIWIPLTLAAICVFGHVACEPLRVCYYATWALNRKPLPVAPADLDPSLCTHLIVAFARLDPTGTKIEPNDQSELAIFKNVTDLKARHPQLKVMLSIGGWVAASDGFSASVSSEASMRAFAENAVTFLRGHNFDGVDLDWEFPGDRGGTDNDKQNFARWLQVIQEQFTAEATGNKQKLLLSVAVSGSQNRTRQSYDVRSVGRYVDFIDMMMYDFHGEWEETINVNSALYSKDDELFIDAMVKLWVQEGAPKEKLVLGMPFYGRTFSLADPAIHTIGALHTGGHYRPYFSICEEIETHHLRERILDVERVPYITYNGTWTSYDNAASLQEKARYVTRNGYGGVMVWSLDMDDVRGSCGHGPYPLMHALVAGLKAQGPGVVG